MPVYLLFLHPAKINLHLAFEFCVKRREILVPGREWGARQRTEGAAAGVRGRSPRKFFGIFGSLECIFTIQFTYRSVFYNAKKVWFIGLIKNIPTPRARCSLVLWVWQRNNWKKWIWNGDYIYSGLKIPKSLFNDSDKTVRTWNFQFWVCNFHL